MSESYGVIDTTEILWLARARFVAHQIYVEGIAGATLDDKEKMALDQWDRYIHNPEIARRGTCDDAHLAAAGVPGTEGWAGREARRDVSSTDTNVSASHMKAAMRELAKTRHDSSGVDREGHG